MNISSNVKPKVVEYKNARWSSPTSIDCNILHPVINEWMPFTCIGSDKNSIVDSDDLWLRLINDKSIPPWVPPTPQEILEQERHSMSCSKTQFSIALGKSRYTTLTTELNKDENWETQVAFDTAQVIFRTQQFVNKIRILLGMTEEETDTLFRQAAQIVV